MIFHFISKTICRFVHTSIMKQLDKSIFDRKISVLGLRIPNKHVSQFMKKLKNILLNKKRVQNVVATDQNNSTRLLLLDEKIQKFEDIPQEYKQFIDSQKIQCDAVKHTITLGYDHMKTGFFLIVELS